MYLYLVSLVLYLTIQNDETEKKLLDIRRFLASILDSQCKCDVTALHISQGEFSCRSGLTESVTYRARITGTPTRSASDMAALVQTWMQSGAASIKVGSFRLQLDPTCDSALDNIHALDCEVKSTPETTTDTITTEKLVTGPNNDNSDESESVSSAQVVGIMLGGIIAGIFLTMLIVLVAVIVIWWKKNKS